MQRPASQPDAARYNWLVSLVFWICLAVAGGLFALVVLAPKWQTYQDLKADYHLNQLQLVSLERDVERLDRTVDALENDPQFAAQVARADFGVARPGDELLPVDEPLTLSFQAVQQPSRLPVAPQSRTAEVIQMFCEHRSLRHLALATSGLLVVLAFALLIDPGKSDGDETHDGSLFSRLLNRYRK